jgi:hypothetical protein
MFTCDVEREGAIVSACAYGGRAHLAGKSQALIGKPLIDARRGTRAASTTGATLSKRDDEGGSRMVW